MNFLCIVDAHTLWCDPGWGAYVSYGGGFKQPTASMKEMAIVRRGEEAAA